MSKWIRNASHRRWNVCIFKCVKEEVCGVDFKSRDDRDYWWYSAISSEGFQSNCHLESDIGSFISVYKKSRENATILSMELSTAASNMLLFFMSSFRARASFNAGHEVGPVLS